jgi:hypothetical protein
MVRSLLVATIKGLGCINLKIGYICFFMKQIGYITSILKMHSIYLAISMCYSKQHTSVPNSIAGHCASCSRLTQQTMLSLCSDDALRELSSPGKNGSFFYLTNDDRYMIKTMNKSEVKV